MEVKENFNLKAYNTFAVDVKCKYFVESDKGEDFAEFARLVRVFTCVNYVIHSRIISQNIRFVHKYGHFGLFINYLAQHSQPLSAFFA